MSMNFNLEASETQSKQEDLLVILVKDGNANIKLAKALALFSIFNTLTRHLLKVLSLECFIMLLWFWFFLVLLCWTCNLKSSSPCVCIAIWLYKHSLTYYAISPWTSLEKSRKKRSSRLVNSIKIIAVVFT